MNALRFFYLIDYFVLISMALCSVASIRFPLVLTGEIENDE